MVNYKKNKFDEINGTKYFSVINNKEEDNDFSYCSRQRCPCHLTAGLLSDPWNVVYHYHPSSRSAPNLPPKELEQPAKS